MRLGPSLHSNRPEPGIERSVEINYKSHNLESYVADYFNKIKYKFLETL